MRRLLALVCRVRDHRWDRREETTRRIKRIDGVTWLTTSQRTLWQCQRCGRQEVKGILWPS